MEKWDGPVMNEEHVDLSPLSNVFVFWTFRHTIRCLNEIRKQISAHADYLICLLRPAKTKEFPALPASMLTHPGISFSHCTNSGSDLITICIYTEVGRIVKIFTQHTVYSK